MAASGSSAAPLQGDAFWDHASSVDPGLASADPHDQAGVEAAIEVFVTSGPWEFLYRFSSVEHDSPREFVRQQLLLAFQRRRQQRHSASGSTEAHLGSPHTGSSGVPSLTGSGFVSSATVSSGEEGTVVGGDAARTSSSGRATTSAGGAAAGLPPGVALAVAVLVVSGTAVLLLMSPVIVIVAAVLGAVLGAVWNSASAAFLIAAWFVAVWRRYRG